MDTMNNATKPKEPTATEKVVDLWFMDTFHNAQGLTMAQYNRFSSAKEELKKQLAAAAEVK